MCNSARITHEAEAQVLRAGDVPLSVGAHPHGACAQLYDGRRGGALQVGAGVSVLHPMGWDAFGMPAENAAMERGGHPKDWTYGNIADMKAQMKPLGLSIDWSREFATCDPEYYGQQQAMFLDIWSRAGLSQGGGGQLGPGRHDGAGQRAGDRRQGLAVGRRGGAARADAVVLQDQRLSEELLRRWTGWSAGPRRCALMQANWIGRSRAGCSSPSRWARPRGSRRLEVYTTRPDTLMGASLPRSAPIIRWPGAGAARPEGGRLRRRMPPQGGTSEEIETAEKTGLDTGIRVKHPFDPNWELPVWIANFILMDYGTGAIFGCPAHDQRDFDFATKYGCRSSRSSRAGGRDGPLTEAFVPMKTERVALHPRLRRGGCRPATRGSRRPSPMRGQWAWARASRSTGCATGG
jgi:leucyl-tRNA synthetase